MRGSELPWLAFGIENGRCQEGERMCSPPRHHQFGKEETEETTGEFSKKFCPEFSREKERRRE